MEPIEALKQALRIIEEQRAEIAQLKSDAQVWEQLLRWRQDSDVRESRRPSRVRFGPSPTFLAHSPEFPEHVHEAARRRQARGGIGP